MNLRSGAVVAFKALKTKAFDVRNRADQPHPTNVLVTFDTAVRVLAESYGVFVAVPTSGPAATLENAYRYERWLDMRLARGELPKKCLTNGGDQIQRDSMPGQSSEDVPMAEGGARGNAFYPGKFLLVGYGDNYLYYAQAPLDMRGPHPNPARPKTDLKLVAGPNADVISHVVKWEGPAVAGSTTPSKESVMGDTALNYAKEMFDEDWASEGRWEWLHIVAHALGGNNEKDNLVAGTYDGNTQMIPVESTIRDLCAMATADRPVQAEFTVTYYPGTRLALDIEIDYGVNSQSNKRVFHTWTRLCFDRLQYDLWKM